MRRLILIQKSAEFENKIWLVQSIDYNDIPNVDGKIFIKFEENSPGTAGATACELIFHNRSDIKIQPSRSKKLVPA
jgi:hypothetical protein